MLQDPAITNAEIFGVDSNNSEYACAQCGNWVDPDYYLYLQGEGKFCCDECLRDYLGVTVVR